MFSAQVLSRARDVAAIGLMSALLAPATARADCLEPPGDITADGATDVVDYRTSSVFDVVANNSVQVVYARRSFAE